MARHVLSRQDARRIAVRAQCLQAQRPTDLLALVHQLAVLQNDPTAAVAPNADLVLWSRLGSDYEPAELLSAFEERELVELHQIYRPAEDIALFTADMATWPGTGELPEWQEESRDWVDANEECRIDILQRLEEDGPLRSRDLPDSCAVPWRSTGWTNNRNVTQLLGFMVRRGEVAVAGRAGRDKLWDLAERVYPDLPPVPSEDAARLRRERRLTSLGIARARGAVVPGEPIDVGDTGDEAVVDGVSGVWRVDPAHLGQPFRGRAALLSPLDRLVYDRTRLAEIFEFDYTLEMYKPVAARRWGYWALPILYGDRLVGKLDATADRKAGQLRVDALHWDVDPSRPMNAAIEEEIDRLADWLHLEPIRRY